MNLKFNYKKYSLGLLIGFLVGFLYLPITLQISLSYEALSSLVQAILFFLFPFSFACIGIGSACFQLNHFKNLKKRTLELILGASLILFILLIFFAPGIISYKVKIFQVPFYFLIQVFPLILFFFFLGGYLTQVIQNNDKDKRDILKVWIGYLFASALGHFVSDFFVESVGANSIILISGVILITLPIIKKWAYFFLAICLILSVYLDLDTKLERLRDISFYKDPVVVSRVCYACKELKMKPDQIMAKFNQFEFMSWSRRGQVRVVKIEGKQAYIVFYNLASPFNFSLEEDGSNSTPIRKFIYNNFKVNEEIAIIGIGAGQSLLNIRPEVLSKKIVAIERSKGIVDFSTKIHPELFKNYTNKVNFIAGDGRNVIERMENKLDYLILESSKWNGALTNLSQYIPFGLFTEESYENMIRALKPNGLLVQEFGYSEVNKSLDKQHIARQSLLMAGKLKIPFFYFLSNSSNRFYFIASYDETKLNYFKSEITKKYAEDITIPEFSNRLCTGTSFVDDNSFMTWHCHGNVFKEIVINLSFGFLLIIIVVLFIFKYLIKNTISFKHYLFFFIIGIAYAVLSLGNILEWKTFFIDELYTFLRMIVYLPLFGIISVYLVDKYDFKKINRKLLLFLCLIVFVFHFFVLKFIPFNSESTLFREVYAFFGMIPLGVLSGMMFPLGLKIIEPKDVGMAFLADSLGTLVSYVLINIILLQYGINIYMFSGAMFYALSIFLLF